MTAQTIPVPMNFFETSVWFIVGMLISLAFPVAVKTLKALIKEAGLEAKGSEVSLGQRIQSAWKEYGGNTYFWILILVAAIGLVLVFIFKLQFFDPHEAALGGIGWESLANKFFVEQKSEAPT